MAVAKRGTLLIMSGPRHDRERRHLHVVCCDPDENGKLVIVSICSKEDAGWHDATTVLQPHEHPWLKHDSYVFYTKAVVVACEALEKGVEQGVMETHDPMNAQVFLKVTKGICKSPHTPRKVKNFMGCAAEVEPEREAA